MQTQNKFKQPPENKWKIETEKGFFHKLNKRLLTWQAIIYLHVSCKDGRDTYSR